MSDFDIAYEAANALSSDAAEKVCRDFAAEFPTPNVLLGLSYAESGRVTWFALENMFRRVLGDALAEVGR